MKKRLFIFWVAFNCCTFSLYAVPEEGGLLDPNMSDACKAKLILVDALMNLRDGGIPIDVVKGYTDQRFEKQTKEQVEAVMALIDLVYTQKLSADPVQAAAERTMFLMNAKRSINQCRGVI